MSAVAVQPKGAGQPTFGTIQITAKTRVDRAERTVFLEQPEITEGNFPSAGAQAEAYLATLRSLLPREVKSISLDRMEASLAILEARQRAASQPLNNNPPAIIFSTRPAMLVPVDGPPVYRPVENTDLERVFNTRALILRDKSGQTFPAPVRRLRASRRAGRAVDNGASDVPADVKKAENQAVKAKQVDLLAGQENPQTKQKPSLKSTPVPTLYVTSLPTELIVIRGRAAVGAHTADAAAVHHQYGVPRLQRTDRAEDLCADLRTLVPLSVFRRAVGICSRRGLAEGFCRHPGRQSAGKREGGGARHAAGGGSRHRQRHTEHGQGGSAQSDDGPAATVRRVAATGDRLTAPRCIT